jgi:AraC-like DNA-binding protein
MLQRTNVSVHFPELNARSSEKVWRVDFECDDWAMPILRAGGISCQRVPLSLTPHVHQGFEVHYLKRGRFGFNCDDGSRHQLSGGQFSLTQPGVSHHGDDRILRPSELLWIVIAPMRRHAQRRTDFLPAELKALDALLRAAGNAVAKAPARMERIFDTVVEICRRTIDGGMRPQDPPLLVHQINAMIHCVCESFAAPAAEESGELAARALAWLRAHLYQEVAIDDLAVAMGLGRSRLHDRFREEQGETPAATLRRLRCEEAVRLLADPDRSIASIAAALHFASSQHFARVFRSHTGRSPSVFRDGRAASVTASTP